MGGILQGILLLFLIDVFGICESKSIDRILPEASKNIDKDAGFNYTVQDMDVQIVRPEPGIILTDDNPHHISQSYGRYRRNSVKDPSMLWPRRIPYELRNINDFWKIRLVELAMNEWTKHTCLKFEPKARGDQSYVVFYFNPDRKSGCYSRYVGNHYKSRNSNKAHVINLAEHCFHPTIVIHELGHVIGLYHEHERLDRDKHVTVDYYNIEDDWYSQFIKRRANEVRNHRTDYDCSSVMHYPPDAYSKNGLPTITTKYEECRKVMGKAFTLSFKDAKDVNLMYSCSRECGFNNCGGESYQGENCECYCASGDRYDTVVHCFTNAEGQHVEPAHFEERRPYLCLQLSLQWRCKSGDKISWNDGDHGEYYEIYVVLTRSPWENHVKTYQIQGKGKDLTPRAFNETVLDRGIEVGPLPDVGDIQTVETSQNVDDIRYIYIRKLISGDEYYFGVYNDKSYLHRVYTSSLSLIVRMQKLYNGRACAGDTFTKGRGGFRLDKDDTLIKYTYTADDCKAACRWRKNCKTAFLTRERVNKRGERMPVRCFLGTKGVRAFKFTDSYTYGEIFLRKC